MSADLVWAITRNNSSFLVKRNGIQLSREAGNLLNKNSFKYSGLNAQIVDVSAAGAKGVSVSFRKKTVDSTKLAKSVGTTSIQRGGPRAVVKSVKKIASGYRKDLVNAAAARASRVLQSQVAGKVAKVRKPRGKKAQQ